MAATACGCGLLLQQLLPSVECKAVCVGFEDSGKRGTHEAILTHRGNLQPQLTKGVGTPYPQHEQTTLIGL